ncbi:MAG: glycogen/starch synthase [Patescibacteria group bacterium]|nr:glycogen/starch synthase [Patescibacteria group bacterium]
MKKIIMISNELSPYKIYGGLGVATKRLTDQLISCGNSVTIIFPSNDYVFTKSMDNLEIISFFMEDINYKSSNNKIAEYFGNISKKIMTEIAKLNIPKKSIFIVHDNEMALTVKLIKKFFPDCKIIFWLHSLYDYPKRKFFNEDYKKLFSCESLLASAINNSDLIVTSSGIIKDSKTIEWPKVINEIKKSLIKAKNENKILEVESFGCLPKKLKNKNNTEIKGDKDYFLFPSRPSFSKGIGFFGELSNNHKNNYDFFAVGPMPKEILELYPAIKEIKWLSQEELFSLMKSAKGVILPSITEGYGLSAAESILLSATTIYHDVGGHDILKNYHNSFFPSLTKKQKEKLYLFWGELLEEKQEPIKIWLKSKANFNDLFEWWEKIITTLPSTNKKNKNKKNNKTWGQLITEEIEKREW